MWENTQSRPTAFLNEKHVGSDKTHEGILGKPQLSFKKPQSITVSHTIKQFFSKHNFKNLSDKKALIFSLSRNILQPYKIIFKNHIMISSASDLLKAFSEPVREMGLGGSGVVGKRGSEHEGPGR